ncbi:MAG TPA: ATP-binding protein [Euzebya sp.]|nr:ATP-binding protein [Euzebya sp.]
MYVSLPGGVVMVFWGRKSELARLHTELSRVRADGVGRMLTIRGRRQVGKSRLLTEFVENVDVPHLFTTAVKNAAPAAQVAHAIRDAATSHHPLPHADLAFGVAPTGWADLFRMLTLAVGDEPAVLVIDEFPWATDTDDTLEGIVQVAWDQHLARKPVLLVLVGSDVAMMERLTEHDRPLFGRAEDWVVHALSPAEVDDALGRRGTVDAVDVYLATGGYPRMVLDAARHPNAHSYVAEELTTDGSRLTVTGIRLLDAEFRDQVAARAVLEAIGSVEAGHATFTSAVANLAGDHADVAFSRALPILMQTKRLVVRQVPVGAKDNSKLRRYQITDPYLRFWLRYGQPHLPEIARGRGDIAVAAFERDFESWRGRAVEPLVHNAISRLASTSEILAGVETVGSWWDRTNEHEYDIVAADRHGLVRCVGTVKWRPRRPLTAPELTALAEGRAAVPKAASAALIAVCPAGANNDAVADLTLTADDIIAAFR